MTCLIKLASKKMTRIKLNEHLHMKSKTVANSTYKKLAVQRLNEALFFASSSVVADNFRLLNRQLLVAAKRWRSL